MNRLFFLVLLLATAANAETRRYTWVEAGRTHEVFLVQDAVADLKAQGLQIRKLSKAALRKSLDAGLPANQSPVFSDVPGGPVSRALPGGVIITFPPQTTDTAAEAWARDNRVQIVQTLASAGGDRSWVVKSEPGFASLDLANQLSQSPGVRSVSPNWWFHLEAR